MTTERLSSFWRKFVSISGIALSYTIAQAAPFAAVPIPAAPHQQWKVAAAGTARPKPRQSDEEKLWQVALESDKAGAYEAYLRKYPNGRYAALAETRLASATAAAEDNGKTAGTRRRDASRPAPALTGDEREKAAAADAQQARGLSAEDELWKAAAASGQASDYRAYLREYPNGRYAAAAHTQLARSQPSERDSVRDVPPGPPAMTTMPASTPRLSAEEELWRSTTVNDTVAAYEAYLNQFPDGRNADSAKAKLAGLKHAATSAASPSGMVKAPSPDQPAPAARKSIRFGDQTMTGDFSADPRTGLMSGTGRIVWIDGNRFEGTLVQGIKEGKGQFTWNNGQRYTGDWARDLPNGKGSFLFANGDRYEGEVKDGEAHGKGAMFFSHGDRYEGDVQHGKPHGQGVTAFKGGDSYAGQWRNGKRHGHGRYTWANGGYWEGEFKDGEPTGNGKMTHVPPADAPRAAMSAIGKSEHQSAGKNP